MHESRQHPRIPCRMAVDIFDAYGAAPRSCPTRDIALGGIFAVGICDLPIGRHVHVALAADGNGSGLHLEGEVTRLGSDGAALAFRGNSAASMEVLNTMLSPKWDGENLLEGVTSMGSWEDRTHPAGWMRLTSLVADWRRLTRDPA